MLCRNRCQNGKLRGSEKVGEGEEAQDKEGVSGCSLFGGNRPRTWGTGRRLRKSGFHSLGKVRGSGLAQRGPLVEELVMQRTWGSWA